jgi:hypothetical protein
MIAKKPTVQTIPKGHFTHREKNPDERATGGGSGGELFHMEAQEEAGGDTLLAPKRGDRVNATEDTLCILILTYREATDGNHQKTKPLKNMPMNEKLNLTLRQFRFIFHDTQKPDNRSAWRSYIQPFVGGSKGGKLFPPLQGPGDGVPD